MATETKTPAEIWAGLTPTQRSIMEDVYDAPRKFWNGRPKFDRFGLFDFSGSDGLWRLTMLGRKVLRAADRKAGA